MNKQVVLISGIGGDIGQTIAGVLRDDFILIGADMNPFLPYQYFVDRFYQIPSAKDQGYFNAVKGICEKEKVDHFMPMPEPELRVLDLNRAVWAPWPVNVVINNAQIMNACLDKLRTVELLERLGLPFPRTAILKDLDLSSWHFPFIVKNRESCGSRQVWTVKDRYDLECVMRHDDGKLIAQELLSSPQEEYTTGVFSDGRTISSITFRRVLGYGGLSKEIELVPEPKLEALSRRVAESMGLAGSLNIQSRKMGEDFVPFEINPRISSTVGFRYAFGFRDVHWSLSIGDANEYTYTPKYRSGRGYRVFKEIYCQMEAL